MDLKKEIINKLEQELPEGFEVSKNPDGKVEVILQDQNSFDGWNSILPKIKDGILNTIKLYDFEGKDDVYIEIKNPWIAKEQSDAESLGVKFDEGDIDKEKFDFLKKSDAVATSHIMMSWKNKLLICHKGMVRSVTL